MSAGRMSYMLKYLKLLIAAVMMTALISCGRDEPLSDYKTKSPQETALKKVLLEFQDGVNRKDADKVSSLIHANAELMVGRERRILSRPAYIEVLPKRLAENPDIAFGKPKMKIENEAAEVRIYMTRGNYNGLVVYHMRLQNDRWYILSWRY